MVTTDLTTEGSFWVRLSSPKKYEEMFVKMQKFCNEDGGEAAAGFFNEGQYCCAKFSEDGTWCRAKVEGLSGQNVSLQVL